ncbi:MAG TPA: protein-disulfide reductase DsbD domain-containing protein [Acidobacteriaceae bacterium]
MKRRNAASRDLKVQLAAIAFCVLSLTALPTSAQIQLGGLGQTDRAGEAKKQHVELLTDAIEVTANKAQQVELRFRVEPGFHINSHHPKDELLIPTELKLDPASLHVADEQYPLGSRFHLATGNGEDLDVYEGEFRVLMKVEAPHGTSTLTGTLRYQACDNAACFPAKRLPVKIAVAAH